MNINGLAQPIYMEKHKSEIKKDPQIQIQIHYGS